MATLISPTDGPLFQAQWDAPSSFLKHLPPTKIQNALYWGLSLNPLIGFSHLVHYALGRLANRLLLPAAQKAPRVEPLSLNPLIGFSHLVHYALGRLANRLLLPAAHENGAARKEEFLCRALKNWNEWPCQVTSHSVQTPDGAILDVTLIVSPKYRMSRKNRFSFLYQKKRLPTIIQFNGNAAVSCTDSSCFPWYIEQAFLRKVPYNFVFFTYRGVGKSKGTFTSPKDLVVDGYSIVQWVKAYLKTPPNQIHFYGNSLGGAVAAETQALDPETLRGTHFNVRSFASTDQLIVESSFGRLWLRKMSRRIFNNHGYKMNPVACF